MTTAKEAIKAIRKLEDPPKGKFLQGFFKTKPGEYGHGDVFIGVTMPQLRALAKRLYKELPLAEVPTLLKSEIHEVRMLGLVILALAYAKADERTRDKIYAIYFKHRDRVNNWDLVDVTAPHVVGRHLYERDREPLRRLARSKRMWDRRIAIVSTFYFIRQEDFADTLEFAELFLDDEEDLMHKATGWMLREIGKRDLKTLTTFLDRHAERMPRTALRYAIERFREPLRQSYLARKRTSVSSRGTK